MYQIFQQRIYPQNNKLGNNQPNQKTTPVPIFIYIVLGQGKLLCTDNIYLHLKNIYKEQELSKDSTTKYFSVVQKEG